jgi:hypothetical protein
VHEPARKLRAPPDLQRGWDYGGDYGDSALIAASGQKLNVKTAPAHPRSPPATAPNNRPALPEPAMIPEPKKILSYSTPFVA